MSATTNVIPFPGTTEVPAAVAALLIDLSPAALTLATLACREQHLLDHCLLDVEQVPATVARRDALTLAIALTANPTLTAQAAARAGAHLAELLDSFTVTSAPELAAAAGTLTTGR